MDTRNDFRKSKGIMGLGSVLIAVALIIIQFVLFFQLFVRNVINLNLALPAWVILVLVFSVYLVNQDMDSNIKLSWIILILGLPVVGILLYIFLHILPGRSITKRRLEIRKDLSSTYMTQDPVAKHNLTQKDKRMANLSKYLNDRGYPVYQNTKVDYYPTGEALFDQMFKDLEEAKEFILVEFFTVKDGEILDRFYDVLSRKVKEGVEVNFLHDGTNAFSFSREMQEKYVSAGINVQVFQPISAYLSTIHNNRDHRKLVIIDNNISYTGGINIADEYANLYEKYGYWKDTGVRLEGQATKNMTEIFMELWYLQDETDGLAKYLNKDQTYLGPGDEAFVQPFGESPYDNHRVAEDAYINIIDNAVDYVYIGTPYITITDTMYRSLTSAAQRGVDVRILTPHIPDHYGIPQQVSRTYYRPLTNSGAKIYEFVPGYNHSKMVVADDEISIVGTINMDYRSFYLHFENGVLIYDEEFANILRHDFDQLFKVSKLYELGDEKEWSVLYRIGGKVLRLFAPLF